MPQNETLAQQRERFRLNLKQRRVQQLTIPLPELEYIEPNMRVKLFLDLVNRYKSIPNNKVLKAHLNYIETRPGFEVKTFDENRTANIDFLVIMRSIAPSGIGINMIECISAFTERSLPGYKYCILNNKLSEYFDDAFSQMIKFSDKLFKEFIVDECKLSLDKKSELFWKDNRNIQKLLTRSMDNTLQFVPRG